MKIVEVYWQDAQSQDGWVSIEEAVNDSLPMIRTVGYLLKETKELIVVTMQLDTKNDKTSMVMTIPRAWIKRIKRLKP